MGKKIWNKVKTNWIPITAAVGGIGTLVVYMIFRNQQWKPLPENIVEVDNVVGMLEGINERYPAMKNLEVWKEKEEVVALAEIPWTQLTDLANDIVSCIDDIEPDCPVAVTIEFVKK